MALSMDLREKVMKAIRGGMSRRQGPHGSISVRRQPCAGPSAPDFNPIEKSFSKIKAVLQRIAARTVDALDAAVAQALRSVTPSECANYFAVSGYDAA